jgi:hypothetical protein
MVGEQRHHSLTHGAGGAGNGDWDLRAHGAMVAELARDVARRLLEARNEREGAQETPPRAPDDSFDCVLFVGA